MAPIPLEPPRRKALLIGINYEEGDVNGTLEGSHINVQVLRKLLIGESCYDIVVARSTHRLPQRCMDTSRKTLFA